MILKDYLRNAVKKKRIPGICVGYMTNESNYFCNVGFIGYKSIIGEKIPVDNETMYDLASLTKVVCTTTLIMKLIEENCFTLDTLVCDLLPDFKYNNVTVKHLLTHTSGLPADDKKYKECVGAHELWRFVLNEPINFLPGSKVEYSDFNYIILGKIIEKFKGSIEEYAKETIFKPLGMDHTMFNPALKGFKSKCAPSEYSEQRGMIQGFVHDGKAFKLNGVSGNAGLFSTCKDLSKFIRMMLDDGYPVLRKDSVDLFKQCYTDGLNDSRTIGWYFNDKSTPVYGLCSNTSLWHTGFAGGSLLIDFEKKCGVVILTNRVHPSRNNDITDIRKEVHKLLLNNDI